MNEIIIKSIDIKNLYGYAKAEFIFDKDMNIISAPTGMGKTSILNAVLFALGFGKSNYQPTIDGYKIKDLKSSVLLVLNVNGLDFTLEVVSEQKWKVVDKESENKSLVGNELSYFYDGISCKLTTYKEKIASLFGINYETIEMFVDIKYFNADTTKWKWNNRREFIFNLLDIDNKMLKLSDDDRFNLISIDLKKGKSEIEIQKMLNAEKKGIDEKQKNNLVLIESKNQELTNLSSIDFNSLFEKKEVIKQELDKLVADNKELAIVQVKNKLSTELQELNLQLRIQNKNNDDIKYNYNNTLLRYKRDISTKENELALYADRVNRLKSDIEDCDIEISIEQEKAFDQSKTICPTCKRQLEDCDIEKLISQFEKNKEYNINKIVARRSETVVNLTEIEKSITCLTETITTLKNEMTAFESNVVELSDNSELVNLVNLKKQEIDNINIDNIESENKKLKIQLSNDYENIIKELAQKDRIDFIKKEILDLQLNNKELARQDSIRIQKANQLKNYILAKVELANDIVNTNFDGISFKLFNLNGALAENTIESTCVAMLDGVEYDKQSNGQKIYSDICVAKALRKLFSINMFMFIDEKQSMTLPYNVDCQCIELITSKESNVVAIRIDNVYNINDTIKEN